MDTLLKINDYTKSPKLNVSEFVTKFGGQPDWISTPEWPLSQETGNPMKFIGQIDLSESVYHQYHLQQKMAYIFITDEEESIEDTWVFDGGENAVIIQPGSNGMIEIKNLATGPTHSEIAYYPITEVCQLEDKSDPKGDQEIYLNEDSVLPAHSREVINNFFTSFSVKSSQDQEEVVNKDCLGRNLWSRLIHWWRGLRFKNSHELVQEQRQFMTEKQMQEQYHPISNSEEDEVTLLDKDFLGGKPVFLQGDEFPEDRKEWIFLAQFSNLPFEINLGDAGIGYVFMNKKESRGGFLFQSA